jgi:hypothetical protein
LRLPIINVVRDSQYRQGERRIGDATG